MKRGAGVLHFLVNGPLFLVIVLVLFCWHFAKFQLAVLVKRVIIKNFVYFAVGQYTVFSALQPPRVLTFTPLLRTPGVVFKTGPNFFWGGGSYFLRAAGAPKIRDVLPKVVKNRPNSSKLGPFWQGWWSSHSVLRVLKRVMTAFPQCIMSGRCLLVGHPRVPLWFTSKWCCKI